MMNDYGVILAEEGSPNWTPARRLLSQSELKNLSELLSGPKTDQSTHIALDTSYFSVTKT